MFYSALHLHISLRSCNVIDKNCGCLSIQINSLILFYREENTHDSEMRERERGVRVRMGIALIDELLLCSEMHLLFHNYIAHVP